MPLEYPMLDALLENKHPIRLKRDGLAAIALCMRPAEASRHRTAARLAGVLLACGLAFSSTKVVERTVAVVPSDLAAYKRSDTYFQAASTAAALAQLELLARIVETLRQVPSIVDPGDCIYSVSPQFTRFHTNRQVLMFDVEQRAGCRYLFTSTMTGPNMLQRHQQATQLQAATEPLLVNAQRFGASTLNVASLGRLREPAKKPKSE